MWPDKKTESISERIDALQSSDVLRGWDKAGAWEKLDLRIKTSRRKRLVMWAVPAAAAALLLFMIGRSFIPATEHTNVTAQKKPVPASIPALPSRGGNLRELKPERTRTATLAPSGGLKRPSVQIDSYQMPVIDTAVPASAIPGNNVVAAPVRLANAQPRPAGPEVIYTLAEIMAEVPEREEKPLIFSPIRRRRMATEAVINEARRTIGPRLELQDLQPPYIIIN